MDARQDVPALGNRQQRNQLPTLLACILVATAGAAAGILWHRATPQSSVPTVQMARPDPISTRGRGIKSIRDDFVLFQECSLNAFDPIKNPNGCLSMVVAENNLMKEVLHKRLTSVQSRVLSDSNSQWIFNYGDMGGQYQLKEAMARLFQRWIDAPVDPNMVRIQDGAGSMLSQISYILGDTNDTILVTAPFYSAFANDFGVYGHLKLHACLDASYEPINRQQLDECYKSTPTKPRIFVLCSPHNPTGIVYSYESMKSMVLWAIDKGMHVVSDEIYALSVFPGEQTTSAATIMSEVSNQNQTYYLGDYVHIVAGLSKDWGMSGFRVGTLFSHNAKLLKALDVIGYYQSLSQYTQAALIQLFVDDEWIDSYVSKNQARLHETYVALKESLDLIGVPVKEAKGGLFAWADFSMYLKDGQTETELWLELYQNESILFTTGESCTAEKPGLFRIVYAWPHGGPLAMKELGRRLVGWKANRSFQAADV